jgi:periplasmic protein TonB
MDREEKLGLGAAVGGHALLLIGLALGLFMAADRIVEPPSMSVTLVGEDAVSVAPDPVQEESGSAPSGEPLADPSEQDDSAQLAMATAAIEEKAAQESAARQKEAAQAEADAAEREAAQTKADAAKASATAAEKARAKEAAARAEATKRAAASAKLRQLQQAEAAAKAAKARAAAEAKRQADARKRKRGQAGLGDVVDAASKTGRTGTGSKTGTPATMTTTEVKTAVNVSLRAEIEPLFKRCAPSGVDVSDLVTLVTLKIGKDKGLIDVDFNSQSGVNASNSKQAPLHKDCALRAVRAASPFKSLPDEGYAQWANWPMKFKTR